MSQPNIYATQGLTSTGRKSVNASRISGTASTSVLSERVHRISEKINEIHVSFHKKPFLSYFLDQRITFKIAQHRERQSWETRRIREESEPIGAAVCGWIRFG